MMPLKTRTFLKAPIRVHTNPPSMPPGLAARRSAASRSARLSLTPAWQIAAIGVLTTATPALSHSLQEVEQQLFKAQSAPSCDFGQVGERFGNVAFGIDDGNHRRGQFAPS